MIFSFPNPITTLFRFFNEKEHVGNPFQRIACSVTRTKNETRIPTFGTAVTVTTVAKNSIFIWGYHFPFYQVYIKRQRAVGAPHTSCGPLCPLSLYWTQI